MMMALISVDLDWLVLPGWQVCGVAIVTIALLRFVANWAGAPAPKEKPSPGYLAVGVFYY
jgi:hypothetical protein